MSPHFLKRLHSFAARPLVGETRGVGLVGAIELVANKETKAPFAKPGSVGPRLQDLAQEEGLITRGIGEMMAFCPPLIITEAEIDEMFKRFDRALGRLESEMGVK
jgi:4-aminobutyrate--pyruvate transaminase